LHLFPNGTKGNKGPICPVTIPSILGIIFSKKIHFQQPVDNVHKSIGWEKLAFGPLGTSINLLKKEPINPLSRSKKRAPYRKEEGW